MQLPYLVTAMVDLTRRGQSGAELNESRFVVGLLEANAEWCLHAII